MTVIYSVAMNKGGVGKTSVVTNLATLLSERYGKKVLIVDLEGQGNSSIAFGLNPRSFKHTIYEVIMGKIEPENAIVSLSPNLDLLPSNYLMNFIEIDILPNIKQFKQPFELLKERLSSIKSDYDYIFLDTPPSLGLVTGNALVASEQVLVPFVPETFATEGLVMLLGTIKEFEERDNPGLKVAAVIGMMVDGRTLLHKEMLNEAKKYCTKNDIYLAETIIPRSIRFANSTAYEGKPATWGNSRNTVVSAYSELLKEVITLD